MPFCRRRFSTVCRSRRTRKNSTRTSGRDAAPEDEEPEPDMSWLPETPTEPCPCCGAEIPENPSWGYICPMCGWEIDYDVEGEPDKPSDQNHGLSLTEAQWNFHSFGTVAPWKIIENG